MLIEISFINGHYPAIAINEHIILCHFLKEKNRKLI